MGFAVDKDNKLSNVRWDSVAFKAGITPDMQLEAVNDQKYTAAILRETILAAEKTKEGIKLLLKRDDEFVTVTLDYHVGMRYPHLERVANAPDLLDPNSRALEVNINADAV